MSKRPRASGAGLFHHIYNRGNNRHQIFMSDGDYRHYLSYLEKYTKQYSVEIIAYALMPNHIHLFINDRIGNISIFMNVLHGRYINYFNWANGRCGHGFGGRFRNKIIDVNNYGLGLTKYIHLQAVKANIVMTPSEYRWTSYLSYIGRVPYGFLKTEIIMDQFGKDIKEKQNQYRAFIENTDNGPIDWDSLESKPGMIVGDEDFIDKISKKLNVNYGVNPIKNGINPIEIVCAKLKLSMSDMINPEGRKARRLRHRAFQILRDEYKLSISRIAHAFKVSSAAVSKSTISKS